jgi:hypothetical protein
MGHCFFGYLLDQVLVRVSPRTHTHAHTLSHSRVGRRRVFVAWTNLGVFGRSWVTRELVLAITEG